MRFVNRNKSNFCSYKEFLILTFGPDKGEQLFIAEKSQLEAEFREAQQAVSSRFVMPT